MQSLTIDVDKIESCVALHKFQKAMHRHPIKSDFPLTINLTFSIKDDCNNIIGSQLVKIVNALEGPCQLKMVHTGLKCDEGPIVLDGFMKLKRSCSVFARMQSECGEGDTKTANSVVERK